MKQLSESALEDPLEPPTHGRLVIHGRKEEIVGDPLETTGLAVTEEDTVTAAEAAAVDIPAVEELLVECHVATRTSRVTTTAACCYRSFLRNR